MFAGWIRRQFSSYQQLYKARRPPRGSDEVGARRKDIYAYDVVPIRDENTVWTYSLPKVESIQLETNCETQREPPTDAEGLRRFELLQRVNAHLVNQSAC